ncbi:MAG: class I SAM-dependent methyltransferase [Treponema sp.]|nr:hypothetical protein [Treponema sp.]MCR5621837.1 class I SAM-dependent methyltransferase [Treponema sp.]
MSDLQELYANRFSEEAEARKNRLWVEICRYLRKFIPADAGTVVDVAAGYCDFINNIGIGKKKFALDLNPDVQKHAVPGVEVLVGDVEESMGRRFAEGAVSLFFMSNFLEHISKDKISSLMRMEYRLLEKGGCMLILTPNIKYVGGKYWDFFDHITPITDKALVEEAESIGFRTERVVERFLPFTTKSALPQAPWIVRLYLALMPLSGRVFGEQSLLLFVKP